MGIHATEAPRDRHSYSRRAAGQESAVALLDQLTGLRASTFPDLIITAYLPVPSETRWGQPSDALRDLAHERRSSLDPTAQSALDRELPRMREALERDWRNCLGVCVFSHRGLRVAVGLREVAVPELVVAERAELRPLDAELSCHPPSIVVVADKEGGRIYASVLDRVTRLAAIDSLPVHRHRQGGSSAEQWQRRQDEHANHNLALVANRVETVCAGRPGEFPVIRVAAPPEAAEMLVAHLTPDLRRRVREEAGLPAYASDAEVERHLVATG